MMPGSTASTTESDSDKAKVTSSATNGIFVRPVAVAGIFRPVQEDSNKPPALPEKRRFSALVGDLRPCSSGSGPGSEDFDRRRQSWDTRQKEVPFGQALLRKTPRKNETTDLRPAKSNSITNGCSATQNSNSVSVGEKVQNSGKCTDSEKNSDPVLKVNSSQPTTASFSDKKFSKVEVGVDSVSSRKYTSGVAIKETKINGDAKSNEYQSTIIQTVKRADSLKTADRNFKFGNTQSAIISTNETNQILKRDVKVPNEEGPKSSAEIKVNQNRTELNCFDKPKNQVQIASASQEKKSDKITVSEGNKEVRNEISIQGKVAPVADSAKQTKKVYGLSKRESKSEISFTKSFSKVESAADVSVISKSDPAKPKIYGLGKSCNKFDAEVSKHEREPEPPKPPQKTVPSPAIESESSLGKNVSKKFPEISKLDCEPEAPKLTRKSFNIRTTESDLTLSKNKASDVSKPSQAPELSKAAQKSITLPVAESESGSGKSNSKKDAGVKKLDRESESVKLPEKNLPVPSTESENDIKVTKTSDSKCTSETAKVGKEDRITKSPTKEFRTVRRTSDVIAAKIQNIFSNFQPEKQPPPLLKKTKIPGKSSSSGTTDTDISLESNKNTTNAEINFPSEKVNGRSNSASASNLKSLSCPEKAFVVEEKKNSTSEDKKIVSKDLIVNSKISASSKVLQETVSINEKPFLKNVNKQKSESSNVVSSDKGVNLEPPLKKADSKIDVASSKQEGKKISDIEGKMPIKRDLSSSDGTKVLLKATNQETDRKSLGSTSSSSLMQNFNKGAGVKKVFSVASTASSIIDQKHSKITTTTSPIVSSSTNVQKSDVKITKVENGTDKISIEKNANVSKANFTTQSITPLNSVSVNTSNSCKTISSISSSSKISDSNVTCKKIVSGSTEVTEISKVEVTKITPSTTPGIVPTVNILFRTKSPQGSNRDENRKKVVIETYTTDAPITSAVIISPGDQKNSVQANVVQTVKEAFKTVEDVKQSLHSSPNLPKKHGILNLQKQEVASVDLTTNAADNRTVTSEINKAETKIDQNKSIDMKVGSNTDSKALDKLSEGPHSSERVTQSSTPNELTKNFVSSKMDVEPADEIHNASVNTAQDKMTVVDISEWGKKFQSVEPEVPRVPLRRRAPRDSFRDSLPPSLPLRSPSRFGSLKRIDDSPRYLPRSPSQSCIPQRYSYTEMLSKVASMGVLPYADPAISKSCSSSSSQVSELWSELSEEQSNATHASEMLEAETTERMRLEKEVHELQNRYSQVQQRSSKMEMEILESKVYRTPELNGDLSEDEDPEGTSSIYKQKYERAVRDMEIMKRRVQQQHEEEMEQKSMLKKAADKRLAEALEDVDEERQIANQWKRKAQKCGAELQDLRLMLEEQMARNGELEKKQRRFDAELNASQEEIKKERLLREKLMREKDQAVNEKYSLDQELQAAKLDSDMLHEKISQLNRELDELTLSSRGEEEVTQLKRAKQELERKSRDQEEELEELSAQVQMLEQAKLRLEMSLEKLRQEHRREASVREEEIEEIRASFSKKIKNLEAQLESEQDERHQLVKQKHELERRIYELTDQPPPHDPEIERRLRRDLKRTKALLRDAQTMLEHTREGQSNKTLIRQLKNQLEDSEFAKANAIKARQAVETELQDCQLQLEEITRAKNEAETRCLQLSREKSAIQTQLEEAEEEMAEVMKKYKAVVAQMSADQKILAEQNQQIAELETERQMLKDQLSEVSHKFEHLAGQSDDTHKVHWLDSKIRDLESKLELEQTTKTRLENQIARLKEQNDRSREECDSLRNKELQAQDAVRRLQRQIRDLREDYSALQQKEADGYRKQHELEMALENTETDLQVTKNDLRLACQRIQDLQNALEDDLDSGTDVPDDSGSDSDTSFELSVLRNRSITPMQRCESMASNLSYDTAEGPRSRTSSFTQELSAFSRMMLRKISTDFLG